MATGAVFTRGGRPVLILVAVEALLTSMIGSTCLEGGSPEGMPPFFYSTEAKLSTPINVNNCVCAPTTVQELNGCFHDIDEEKTPIDLGEN